ncbi:MAG: TetR/AcrR family transcriptional regulator [Acetobacteraceae bacterium]|nr:TetR/AcrR family transcriptional regulator [Acetobacteraceae bacterium]
MQSQGEEPKRRTRRKDARPAEIVEAALALFAERGFAATKLEDVAARAGIGKGTLYLYFSNKEELFRAVVRQGLLPNLEAAEAMVAAHTGSASDILRQIASQFLRLIDTDLTAIPKLVITEAGNFPAIAEFYAEEVVKRGIRLIAGVIALGVESGEFRPIDTQSAVPLFVAPFLMMALWRHSLARHTDVGVDPRRVIETHLDVLLRGLAAKASE